MNADVLTTRVADGIAVITLGSARRIYFDEEMGDALTEALDGFAGDAKVRVVVVTGGAPGYFIRHFTIAALIDIAESLRASGRQWPENATYNGGILRQGDGAVREHAKAGNRRHFRHSPGRWIRVRALLRSSYRRGWRLPDRISGGRTLDSFPAPAARKGCHAPSERRPRSCTSSWVDPLTPREAERKGLVHETVSGKALDRAMEIARRLSSFTPESVAYIKRLVRNATETPLAQGLALERNLFLKLCITEPALARMRSYEEKKITSPSRSIEV